MTDTTTDTTSKKSNFGIGELGQVPATTIEDELEAARLQPRKRSPVVKCSCGHSVPSILVMSTSRGTSCPDCYDRMDDN
jgi:hypothetical protein